MNEQGMIKLTTTAMHHIAKIIKEQNAIGFRLAVKKTGCSGFAYVPAAVKEINQEDCKMEVEGLSLFVDKNSIDFLQGTVIDFVDHGFGQTKLIFHNPNAGDLCGCGESFNLKEPE